MKRFILLALTAVFLVGCARTQIKEERDEPIQIVPKWGFEKNSAAYGLGGAERLYSLEGLFPLTQSMRVKAEFGRWFSKGQDGRESSWLGSLSWGFHAQLPVGFFGEAFIGPAWITNTDTQLGSSFQIRHDVSVGMQSVDGFGLALYFTHVSNGNTFPGPNQGRDFFGLRFLIPLAYIKRGG